jgi:hypothetical protein
MPHHGVNGSRFALANANLLARDHSVMHIIACGSSSRRLTL